uniref:hypothetical protein n=1 Tax=Rhodoferax sp. TaxID=50421 RepID=UPI00351D5FC8
MKRLGYAHHHSRLASRCEENHCTFDRITASVVKRWPTSSTGDATTPECTPQGLKLIDKVDGLEHAELEKLPSPPLRS